MSGSEHAGALNTPIAVTFFKNFAATEKREELYTLAGLVSRIRTVTAASKGKLPWLKLARFGNARTEDGSLRSNANVEKITGIEADYDGEQMTFDEARNRLEQQGVASLLYTSPSHTEDAPRFRVLCPTSEELPPAEREHLVGRLNGLFEGIFSGESFTLSQAYYFGSVKHNPSHRVELIDGTPIDLHDDLDEMWIGRPNTGPKTNGHAGPSSGPIDRDALLREMMDGTNYHQAAVRLAGHFARHGLAFMEARAILIAAMEAVPKGDRDQRWHSRRGDLDRVLRDIFGKEAKQRDEAKSAAPEADDREPGANGAGRNHAKAEAHATVDPPKTYFDPWEDPPPPEWPGGVLSRRTEETLAAISLRDGVDYAAQSIAYICAASGAAPKDARFTPYQDGDWTVPPIFWVMMIAESAQRKTAIVKNAFSELKRIHGIRWSEYNQELAQWNALAEKEKREKGKPIEPHSFIVSDFTVEKLQQILAANSRGTMLLKDEIAAIFDFGRYARTGGGATERAFYLEAYEGEPHPVHRVGRDSLYIRNAALSIFGGVQPARLADFKGLESDGFLQRFAIVSAQKAALSRPDVKVPNLPELHRNIEQLARSASLLDYRTTPEGSELLAQTEREGAQFASITDYGLGFQGFCGKLHATHARLALILHMLEGPRDQVIPIDTIRSARKLTRYYLLRSAANFYSAIPGSQVMLHRDIGGWLLNKAKNRVLASDLTAGVAGCRGLTSRQIGEALDRFITGGWLEPESEFPTNRAWRLDIAVRQVFAGTAQAERERHEAIRAQIREIADDGS